MNLFFVAHPSGLAKGAILGGSIAEPSSVDLTEPLLVASNFPDDLALAGPDEETAGFVFVDSAALLESGSPLAANLPTRDGLLTYKIAKGDTLSSVAAQFGISLNTIFWTNPDVRGSNLTVGRTITIAPVSGVPYRPQEGDTAESIAALFNVPVASILKYNKHVTLAAIDQDVVIVPGAKPIGEVNFSNPGNLPAYPEYYIAPISHGWQRGGLHSHNGLDFANVCGTPIFASASGYVTKASVGGWEGGYGNLVEIDHPNNTQTLYAHADKVLVEAGQYVEQGQELATMGSTGNSTGCHVHFEIHGAQNTVKVKPS